MMGLSIYKENTFHREKYSVDNEKFPKVFEQSEKSNRIWLIMGLFY